MWIPSQHKSGALPPFLYRTPLSLRDFLTSPSFPPFLKSVIEGITGKTPLDRAQSAYHAHINGTSESKAANYLVGFRDLQAPVVVQAFNKISESIRWGGGDRL